MASSAGRLINRKKSNRKPKFTILLFPLSSAVRTGLEPATPCVTGMYSNQAELPHLSGSASGRFLGLQPRCFPFASAKLQPFSGPTKFFRRKISKKFTFSLQPIGNHRFKLQKKIQDFSTSPRPSQTVKPPPRRNFYFSTPKSCIFRRGSLILQTGEKQENKSRRGVHSPRGATRR